MTAGHRVAVAVAALLGATLAPDAPAPPTPAAVGPARAAVPFVANRGQADPQVAFYARTFGGTVFVTRAGDVVYALPGPEGGRGAALIETLVDPLRFDVAGREPSAVRVSSFVGNKPAARQSDLPTFDSVGLGEVYRGVDVTLKAHGGTVEKIFSVAPGADPEAIRLRLAGVDRLAIDADGRLTASTAAGPVAFSAPVAFQVIDDVTRAVDVAYTVTGNTYGFALGAYDPSRPLVIDPALASTFLGGSADEYVAPIAFDTSGSVFVVGTTASTDLPATPGAYDLTLGGTSDVFVAKFDPNLSTLQALTYVGGSLADNMPAMTLDASGHVLLAMRTDSVDIPITPGAFQAAKKAGAEMAVVKLDSSLSSLLASTYLGGTGNDAWCCGLAIGVDAGGAVFVATISNSVDFPTTPGAFDRTYNDYNTDDVVIAKLDGGLTSLLAGTYVGGGLWDVLTRMAIDDAGNVWVLGRTSSSNYPTTAGAYHGDYADPWPYYDGFLSRLSNNLTTLQASTYLGSTADLDIPWDLAVAPDGSVYVAGSTESSLFPVTVGAYDTTYNGGAEDGFIAHLNPGLTTLLASTFVGGSGFERTGGLALDGAGVLHIGGSTQSANFPTTPDALQPVYHPGGTYGYDGLYMRMNGALTSVLHATFIGGSGDDGTYRPLLNAAGDVYLGGSTTSSDFPVTPGAHDTTRNGGTDAYVMRYGPPNTAPAADAGPDVGTTCDEGCAAQVTLDGSASSDAEGDPLSYTWTGPFGSATGVAPAVTLGKGTHEVTLEVADGMGGVASDTVTITVTDSTPPAFSTVVGPFTISVTSLAGTPFTVPLPDAIDNCTTVYVDSDAPALFPLGSTTVTFTATDEAGNQATATTTITVMNSPPAAQNTAVVVPEDGLVDFALSASDPDGHALAFAVTTPPAHGTLSGLAPALTYMPAANFNGVDALTFSVDDGFGGVASGTVTITVNEVNDPPVAAGAAVTTAYQTPVAVTLAASDVDGDTLAFSVAVPPAGGTLSGSGAALTYTPNAGFSGADAFTFAVSDGHGGSSTAVVSITVGPAPPPTGNHAPVATDDLASVREGSRATMAVLANDLDQDGDVLRIARFSRPRFGDATRAGQGRLAYRADAIGAVAHQLDEIRGLSRGEQIYLRFWLHMASKLVEHGRSAQAAALLERIADRLEWFTNHDLHQRGRRRGEGHDCVEPRDASEALAVLRGLARSGVTDSFEYTVTDSHGGTATATVTVLITLTAPGTS